MSGHAVVLGGSIAGLVAARVLSDHFQRVTIIERDSDFERSAEAPARRGTPQSGHLHLLLEAGRRCLDTWFPGFSNELVAAGAHRCDAGEGLKFYLLGGWRKQCRLGIDMYTQSRHLLEGLLRRRVLALDGVDAMSGVRAEGFDVHRAQVEAVQLSGASSSLGVDFLADCSGRASQMPQWLAAAGYAEPERHSLHLGIRYASQFIRVDPAHDPEHNAIAIYGPRPEHQRHAVALRIEQGLWFVGCSSYGLDAAPGDESEVAAYFDGLPEPDIAAIYHHSQKLGRVRQYNFPEQRWLRYDRVKRLPNNLVVLGDAVCSLDPVFGQGMTMACLGALSLEAELGRPTFDARRTSKAIARSIAPVWNNTTTEAYRYPFVHGVAPVGGPWVQGLMAKLTDRIYRVSVSDPGVYRAFSRVLHMLDGPERLLAPGFLARLCWPRASL